MPVRVEDYTRHRMLPEYFELSEVAVRPPQCRQSGRKTPGGGGHHQRPGAGVLRLAPGIYGPAGLVRPLLYPGYQFQAVDRLLTNFHLPRSTLLLLVSAFAGRELILRAYAEAVKERYRFYSYGDCMLII